MFLKTGDSGFSDKNESNACSIFIALNALTGLTMRLSRIDDEYGVRLGALYFSKEIQKKKPQKINPSYVYIKGLGVEYKWDQSKPLDIKYCTDPKDTFFVDEAKNAVDQWASALKGRLQVSFSLVKNNIYPFSDLSQTCIFAIDGLLSLPDPRVGNYGLALPLTDDETHLIKSSVIMIFKNEFEKGKSEIAPNSYVKFDSDEIKRNREFTLLHELGHFFGLNHVFGGDDSTPQPESVMSYDFTQDLVIKPYDIEAIQALYPKQ